MCFNYITRCTFFFFSFDRLSGVFEIIKKKLILFVLQVLPPPNVTGALHIGHALTAAVEVLLLPKFYVYALHILSSLRFFFIVINWYILHTGYNYSLAENVWIQYLVGSWGGPCWDCDTGSSFIPLTKLLVNLLHVFLDFLYYVQLWACSFVHPCITRWQVALRLNSCIFFFFLGWGEGECCHILLSGIMAWECFCSSNLL